MLSAQSSPSVSRSSHTAPASNPRHRSLRAATPSSARCNAWWISTIRRHALSRRDQHHEQLGNFAVFGGSGNCHRLQVSDRHRRVANSFGLRPVSRTEGVAAAKLGQAAVRRQVAGCGRAEPCPHRPLRLLAAVGSPRISRPRVLHSGNQVIARSCSARCRSPARRRRQLRESSRLFQTPPGSTALHIARRRENAAIGRGSTVPQNILSHARHSRHVSACRSHHWFRFGGFGTAWLTAAAFGLFRRPRPLGTTDASRSRIRR